LDAFALLVAAATVAALPAFCYYSLQLDAFPMHGAPRMLPPGGIRWLVTASCGGLGARHMNTGPRDPAPETRRIADQARAELVLVQELLSLHRSAPPGAARPPGIQERLERLSEETRHYLEAVLREEAGGMPGLGEITANLPRFSITHWLHEATKDLREDAARQVQRAMREHYAQALEEAPSDLSPHQRQERALRTLDAPLEAKRRALLTPSRIRWVLYTTLGWTLWLLVSERALGAMLTILPPSQLAISAAFLFPVFFSVLVWLPQQRLLAKAGLRQGWVTPSLFAIIAAAALWLYLLAPRWLELGRGETSTLRTIEFAAFLFVGLALGMVQTWRLRKHMRAPFDWFIWTLLGWAAGGVSFLYVLYYVPLPFRRHLLLAFTCAALVQSAINCLAFRQWSGRPKRS